MPNMLQQPPQGGLQAPAQPQQAPPPPPTPEQVQNAHTHFSYMQQMLNKLIKMPDSELNLKAVIESAADMIQENQLSGGKKGVSAQEVAVEMSDPKFPTKDSSAQQIRQFLQSYFDKSIMAQAATTAKFGGPQQAPQQ